MDKGLTLGAIDRLGGIRVPTLILAGRYGERIPVEHSILLHERIPEAELVIFEEGGTWPMGGEPEKYRDATQRSIDGLQ